jgi:hypothetical protein
LRGNPITEGSISDLLIYWVKEFTRRSGETELDTQNIYKLFDIEQTTGYKQPEATKEAAVPARADNRELVHEMVTILKNM